MSEAMSAQTLRRNNTESGLVSESQEGIPQGVTPGISLGIPPAMPSLSHRQESLTDDLKEALSSATGVRSMQGLHGASGGSSGSSPRRGARASLPHLPSYTTAPSSGQYLHPRYSLSAASGHHPNILSGYNHGTVHHSPVHQGHSPVHQGHSPVHQGHTSHTSPLHCHIPSQTVREPPVFNNIQEFSAYLAQNIISAAKHHVTGTHSPVPSSQFSSSPQRSPVLSTSPQQRSPVLSAQAGTSPQRSPPGPRGIRKDRRFHGNSNRKLQTGGHVTIRDTGSHVTIRDTRPEMQVAAEQLVQSSVQGAVEVRKWVLVVYTV